MMVGPSHQLRVTHPGLAIWVDVTVHERDGRHKATADLAEDSRDIGPSGARHKRRSGLR